jgi:hypothetical protein
MKATFKALFTQIKTASGIAWVDEDFGQIDLPEGQQPAVKFPCALVTVSQLHTPLGGSQYDVRGTITVRVAYDRLADRSAMANEQAVDRTLAKMDVADAVRDALEGFESEQAFGMLYITEYTPEIRNDSLSVKVIKFTETHEESYG